MHRTILPAALLIGAGAAQGGIIVGHDVVTLSSTYSGAAEQQFAVNIAKQLTGGSGNILMIESGSDALRDYGDATVQAIRDAGFGVHVDRFEDGYASDISTLDQYDAVFFGTRRGNNLMPDMDQLHSFMDGGGSAYVFGGNGPNALTEAHALNQFLNPYGAGFLETSSYNGSNGFQVTDGSHPLFEGLEGEFIRASNGNAVLDLGTESDSSETFYADVNGFPLLSMVDTVAVPAPGTAAILGVLGFGAVRRRRA